MYGNQPRHHIPGQRKIDSYHKGFSMVTWQKKKTERRQINVGQRTKDVETIVLSLSRALHFWVGKISFAPRGAGFTLSINV